MLIFYFFNILVTVVFFISILISIKICYRNSEAFFLFYDLQATLFKGIECPSLSKVIILRKFNEVYNMLLNMSNLNKRINKPCVGSCVPVTGKVNCVLSL
jgi:hypothetical protein